jgi:uncharacterized RDD family membrane protein YckC
MGARLGAWFLDLVFFAMLSLIPLALAVVSGGVGLNPEAARQMDASPYVQPTVPLLTVSAGPLVGWAAVWVAMAIAYAAACWAFFRGLPGQRLLSLQVADAASGKNLSLPRATLRAFLVNGIPAAATAVLLVAVCEVMATIVPASYGSSETTSYLYASENGRWDTLVSLCDMASWGWPLLLVILTAVSRDKRGLHDRLSGSVVVGRGIAPGPWGYPYGPMPATPYGYPYGPQPGAPAGYPGAPVGYPGLQSPPGDPGQDATVPPQAMSAGDDQPPPAVRAEPASSEPAGHRPQVFGAMLPEGLRVAGFSRRAAAYCIDIVIVLGIFGVIGMAVLGTTVPSSTPPPERLLMLTGLIGGLAQAVYFVATWSIWRGSIGQKAVGLQVGDESTGRRLGWVDSLVRWAVLQGPFALYLAIPEVMRPLGGVIAMVWVWLLILGVRQDPDGRGYHDRIAHSLVAERV